MHGVLFRKGFNRPQCESENIKFKRSIYFTKDLDVGDLVEELR